jgi:hypothetical protein
VKAQVDWVDQELQNILSCQAARIPLPREGRSTLLKIATCPSPQRVTSLAKARLEAVTRPAQGVSESVIYRVFFPFWWLELGIR